jgi:hypothetical protein
MQRGVLGVSKIRESAGWKSIHNIDDISEDVIR